MIKKISLMGLTLDDYSFPEAVKITESFLTDTSVSTVLSVDMEKLLAAGENGVVKEVLSGADYTVVTDPAVLEEAPESASGRRSEVEEGTFLNAFLNHMYRADRSFYLVASTQSSLDQMHRTLKDSFSYIRILGETVITQGPEEYERSVNAINILVPDIILSCMCSPDEEYFLKQCRSQLCACIWYSAGTDLTVSAEKFSLIRRVRRMKDKLLFRSRNA